MTLGSYRAVNALFVTAVLVAASCGGASRSSKSSTSKLAESAPPPPSEVNEHQLERKVTREAQQDFTAAYAFYEQQQQAGWNAENCVAAARRFQQIASDHDKVVEARFNAGLSFHHCGMLEAAEREYQAGLKINTGHSPSLTALGEIYYSEGNISRGEQYWNKAVQADQKTSAARNNLAWLLLHKMRKVSRKSAWKKHEEAAKQHLSRVLAVDSDNIEAYVIYALIYMEGYERNKSRLELANLLLEEGAKRDSEYAPLWNARGLLQLKRENVGRALSLFERAVALDPMFMEARMNVGNIVLGFRKYDVSKQQFEAVLKLQPKNYEATIGLGVAQRGLGDLQAAEASYNQARQLEPARGMAHYNLGLLYKDFYASASANEDEAISAYKKARTYFKQYVSKRDVSRRQRRAAEDHIEDCDKAIKQLEEVKRMKGNVGKS